MLLKPAVLKGSLATGLGVGAGPGVPGDPAFSVNNSFCLFCKKNLQNIVSSNKQKEKTMEMKRGSNLAWKKY